MSDLPSKLSPKKAPVNQQPAVQAYPNNAQKRRLIVVSAILVVWLICLLLMAGLT